MNGGTLEQEEDKATKLLEELRRIRENEKAKFVAAALDRLSTAFVGIGVIGPIVTVVFRDRPLSAIEPVKLVLFVICVFIACILHLWGQRCLERLR